MIAVFFGLEYIGSVFQLLSLWLPACLN